MIKPVKCKCGSDARIRQKDSYLWVECKKKCGMKTGFHRIMFNDAMIIEPHKESAVFEWNRLVQKHG